MKNSKLLSIVLITIISLSVIFMGKEVFAATAQDLTQTTNLNELKGSSGSSSSSSPSSSSSSSSSSLNSSNSSSTSLNKGNNTTSNTANNVLRTTNTSSVNNSNLPKTGIGDSMPGVILIVVLGISAIYAYKKIQDYRNI